MKRAIFVVLLISLQAVGSFPFLLGLPDRTSRRTVCSRKASVVSNGKEVADEIPFQVKLNEFFKGPVPSPIRQSISLFYESHPEKDPDVVTMLTAAPSVPGHPRPLWLVLLGSLPTGLLFYGWYKFAVEEELLQMELERGEEPRGFGGYGTLGFFSYGMLLGPLAALLHVPGELCWSIIGVIFIFYTQYLLYERVNALFIDEGKPAPLQPWWFIPVFIPFNFIVGLRQVHFLSQYLYERRGVVPPPHDPVAEFFPFIKVDTLTWHEFMLTPSLWCSLLDGFENIDKKKLPSFLQDWVP